MKKTFILFVFIALSMLCNSAVAKSQGGKTSYAADDEAIESLAKSDLVGASEYLQRSGSSVKDRYLLREVSRIVAFDPSNKIAKEDQHRTYQNIATSYHNLYLFLLSKGISNEKFFHEARKYYKKAYKSGKGLHREECKLLDASILAASGDIKKSEKAFEKVDQSMLRGDFETSEYMAAYYASTGNTAETIRYLETAYEMNPERTVAWVTTGDDFFKVDSDPAFINMMKGFSVNQKNEMTLSMPPSKKPALEVSEPSPFFMKSTDMPKHKKLKRKKKK